MLLSFICGTVFGFSIHAAHFAKKRFQINIGNDGKAEIVPLDRPKHKMEFVSEPTKKDVEEAEREPEMKEFLAGVKQPPKEEEEEEI